MVALGGCMNTKRALVGLLLGTIAIACGGSSEATAPTSIEQSDGGASDACVGAACTRCKAPQETDADKGDCKKVICDATGALVTALDDTDVPAPSECAEFACAGGQKVPKPKAAGLACTGGKCDGKGACTTGLGDKCSSDDSCMSGHCVDGVCCNESCTGECKSCGNPGSEGTCSNIPRLRPDAKYTDPVFLDPNATCDTVALCNGAGKCLKLKAKGCNVDGDCLSAKCAPQKVCYGATGETCNGDGQCASEICNGGTCT